MCAMISPDCIAAALTPEPAGVAKRIVSRLTEGGPAKMRLSGATKCGAKVNERSELAGAAVSIWSYENRNCWKVRPLNWSFWPMALERICGSSLIASSPAAVVAVSEPSTFAILIVSWLMGTVSENVRAPPRPSWSFAAVMEDGSQAVAASVRASRPASTGARRTVIGSLGEDAASRRRRRAQNVGTVTAHPGFRP